MTATSTPPAAAEARGVAKTRLDAIDLLRGLVIALMVLDHTRDFFHRGGAINPTDLAHTTPALFMTRWITHLCAPTFVFLAGVSVYLQKARGKDNISLFLLTRGLWLIVLEVTVVSFGFNFAEPFVLFQVIWAIGAGFVLMAALVHLPRAVVLGLAALIVVGHDVLTPIDSTGFGGALTVAWDLAFALKFAPPVIYGYPAIPWLGVMLLGYVSGPIFMAAPAVRNRRLLVASFVALASFVLLRFINVYGDPQPWGDSRHPFLSFINVSKYPPSLDYVLLLLGVALPIFVALDRFSKHLAPLLLPFGRTPLFTYVVHLYVVHGSALAIGLLVGVPAVAFTNVILSSQALADADWGVSLPLVYVVTLVILAVLYPAARWFAGVKARRRDWWLSYL